jgi:hypothetical protein
MSLMVKEETGRGYKAPCPVFSFVENKGGENQRKYHYTCVFLLRNEIGVPPL